MEISKSETSSETQILPPGKKSHTERGTQAGKRQPFGPKGAHVLKCNQHTRGGGGPQASATFRRAFWDYIILSGNTTDGVDGAKI